MNGLLRTLFLFPVVAPLLFVHVPLASAGEIQYGNVESVEEGSVRLLYKGPWGEERFDCGIDNGFCVDAISPTRSSFPLVLGKAPYAVSGDVRYAVSRIDLVSASYYSLFAMGGGVPRFISLIPFYEPAGQVTFTSDGSSVLFFSGRGGKGKIARYDISSGKVETVETTQTELPFLSISPSGRFVATYNYVEKVHKVWDIQRGSLLDIPSEIPARVVFFGDGSAAAYAGDENGYRTLFSASLDPFSPGTLPRRIGAEKEIVADYEFLGNVLYYLSNEAGPFQWTLYSLDLGTGTKKEIAQNVSYGHPLLIAEERVLYGRVEGKNSNVYIYDPADESHIRLSAMPASSAATNVIRTPIELAGTHGVLLSPSGTANGNLFVWLHGGPERQVSLGYHPYLSYAHYDELLERLVAAGSYVLKLDYAGSWGYGQEFIDRLKGSVGRADVEDVVSATKEIKAQKNDVRNVYLVGVSYGGYLALRSLGNAPELFSGAVSINGVTDWYGLISRIPSSPFAELFGGGLNQANALDYFRASAYNDVRKIDGQKILLVYGEVDDMVPTWQTTDFYNFLKAFGKNAELVPYKGEGHILKERGTLNGLCRNIASRFSLSGVSCED